MGKLRGKIHPGPPKSLIVACCQRKRCTFLGEIHVEAGVPRLCLQLNSSKGPRFSAGNVDQTTGTNPFGPVTLRNWKLFQPPEVSTPMLRISPYPNHRNNRARFFRHLGRRSDFSRGMVRCEAFSPSLRQQRCTATQMAQGCTNGFNYADNVQNLVTGGVRSWIQGQPNLMFIGYRIWFQTPQSSCLTIFQLSISELSECSTWL